MKWICSSIMLLFLSLNIIAQNNNQDTILLASENIYFDFGKDKIRDTEIEKLNQFSTKIQGNINGFIRLTGHTDAIGSNKNNDGLSERRANNVIQFLVKQQIARLPFYTSFNGENIPVADNDSKDGRQLNRRVEIEVFQINIIKKEITTPPPVVKEEIVKVVPKVKPSLVEFIVKDEETDALISTNIIYKRFASDKEQTYQTQPKGLGNIYFSLKESSIINFDFYAEGYFHNSEEVSLKIGEEKLVTIKLKPIKKGNKLALKNLYFYGNQAKLLPTSIPELKRLKNSLAMNPNAIVEIGGHINYPNTHPNDVPEWSVILSQRRAEVIYKYLIDSDINPKCLTHKGYSNTEMVNPKAMQEIDMAPNRRVEIKVMGWIEE